LTYYCYAINTKSTTVPQQASQPASSGKRANYALDAKRVRGLAVTTLP